MNSFSLSALCLLGVCAALAEGVTVQDGKFSFPLESVKKLKGLQGVQEPSIRSHKHFDGPLVPTLCNNPKFPEELKPLCKEPNAPQILNRLESSQLADLGFSCGSVVRWQWAGSHYPFSAVAIAEEPSTCEICAFAACAGC